VSRVQVPRSDTKYRADDVCEGWFANGSIDPNGRLLIAGIIGIWWRVWQTKIIILYAVPRGRTRKTIHVYNYTRATLIGRLCNLRYTAVVQQCTCYNVIMSYSFVFSPRATCSIVMCIHIGVHACVRDDTVIRYFQNNNNNNNNNNNRICIILCCISLMWTFQVVGWIISITYFIYIFLFNFFFFLILIYHYYLSILYILNYCFRFLIILS
jgi:hypothetical protein